MKKMKVAIIGQGRSGRGIHGEYFLSNLNNNIEVVAIVDEIDERRERGMKEFGCDGYASYTELFGRKDIDLIINASFSHMHYAIAKDCLQHGYNVLNEKPFAKTIYECMDLMKTAKENGVIITAFHQSLYGPTVLKMKEIIASGKIGNVKQINLRYSSFGRRWDWQTLQSFCAGGVYNTGPHPIGIALDLIDWDPQAKVAYSHLDTALTLGDGNDMAKLIITAPGKPVIDVEVNSADGFPSKNFKVMGDLGTITCGVSGAVTVKYLIPEELEPRQVISTPLTNPETRKPMYCGEKLPLHVEEIPTEGDPFSTACNLFYNQMYETIMNGAPLYVTPEKASKAIELIEVMHAQNPLPIKF